MAPPSRAAGGPPCWCSLLHGPRVSPVARSRGPSRTKKASSTDVRVAPGRPRLLAGRVAGVADRLVDLLPARLLVVVRDDDDGLRVVGRGVRDALHGAHRYLGLVGVPFAVPAGDLDRFRLLGGASGRRHEERRGERQGGRDPHGTIITGSAALGGSSGSVTGGMRGEVQMPRTVGGVRWRGPGPSSWSTTS